MSMDLSLSGKFPAQTASFIIGQIHRSKTHNFIPRSSVRHLGLCLWMCHLPLVICQSVSCHMSSVIRHLSSVSCQTSSANCEEAGGWEAVAEPLFLYEWF